MQEGAKRRLIGAAVVVVLLVIFLPMLLVEEETLQVEEETLQSVSEREIAIPPPLHLDQGYDAPVTNPPVEPFVPTFPEYGDPIPEYPSSPQELPPPEFFETPTTKGLETIPKPSLAPVEEALPAAKPKLAPAKPSAPARSSPGPSSWIIQVASLQEHARADKLAQDLRVKGFPAYIQETRVKQKLWYRIRIGPELTRKRIESMAASLLTKTGLKGQIQRYP